METKRMDDYFKKAQQLPLAMSLTEVKSLIGLKGVTSPPKKSWWNLNNFIIMSSSIIIITAAALLFSTPETHANYTPRDHTIALTSYQTSDAKEDPNMLFPAFEKIDEQESKPSIAKKSRKTVDLAELSEQENPLFDKEELSTEMTLYEEAITHVDSSDSSLNLMDTSATEELFSEELLEDEFIADFEGEIKKVTQSISAANIETLLMRHRNGDIEISTWEKNEIEVTASFKLKTATPEDTQLGLDDFTLSLDPMGSKLMVGNNWDDLNNCTCTSQKTYAPKGIKKLFYFPTKNKAQTDKGESFEYENFQVMYEVKIPQKLNVDVLNRNANIKVPDIDGNLTVNLLRGELRAQNVSNTIDIVVKYGDLQIGDFSEGEIVLFKSEADIGSNDRLKLKSNYSTLQYGGGKELDLSAFKSNFSSDGQIDELHGTFKYGEFTLNEHALHVDLEVFKSEIKVNTVDHFELNATYINLKAEKIDQFNIKNGFKCQFDIEEATVVEGTIKYTPLKIEILKKTADIHAFKGEIEIKQVMADFSKLDFETKYTDIDLVFNPDSKYELDAKTTYSDFNVPEEIMDKRLQEGVNNNSNHFIGTFNKSSTKESSKVFVNSFQGTIRLN